MGRPSSHSIRPAKITLRFKEAGRGGKLILAEQDWQPFALSTGRVVEVEGEEYRLTGMGAVSCDGYDGESTVAELTFEVEKVSVAVPEKAATS